MDKPLRRTKRITVRLTIKGEMVNINIDNLTASFIPPGLSRPRYAKQCLALLWQHLHPDQPQPDDVVAAISVEYGCSYVAVLTNAIALTAGRVTS